MADSELNKRILTFLGDKLRRIGINEDELGEHFDLVKTGLVNSLEFVDLVAGLEKEFQCEIDFESALEKGNLTTLGGLVLAFENSKKS